MSKLIKSAYVSYVYLIGYDNKIKIGKANKPRLRLSQLQVGIPDEISLIGAIGCTSEEEALELENFLHEEYEHKHIRAEWYTLTPEDCLEILTKYVDMLDVEIPQSELAKMIEELSSSEFKVMLYVYSRPDGWLFKNREIMEYTGLSERVVKASKNSLKRKKYLFTKNNHENIEI